MIKGLEDRPKGTNMQMVWAPEWGKGPHGEEITTQ